MGWMVLSHSRRPIKQEEEKGNMVPAYIYNIAAYQSALDIAHGHEVTVREVYIPKIGLCFNLHDRQLNIFEDDGSRMREGRNVEKIELDEGFCSRLTAFLRERDALTREAEQALSKSRPHRLRES